MDSHPLPTPSVLQIDESGYPFCSRLFEPETGNGVRIRELLCGMGVSERSELSLFEVGDARDGNGGDLYERLDVGDEAVKEFVYDTRRCPDVRIFFVLAEPSRGVPPSLTREAFVELLEETGVPPAFIEVHVNNNGASIGSPVYSDADPTKPIAYQLMVKFPHAPSVNAAIYFRHDFTTGRSTCLVFGNHLDRLQNRFQQLFPSTTNASTHTARPRHSPPDPFLVLSAIAAEYVSVMEHERAKLDAMTCEQESKTGITAHFYDESLRVSAAALPSRIKALHVCDAYLMFFIDALHFQITWVAFLQAQHRMVEELQTKVMSDGTGGNLNRGLGMKSIASRKVAESLDLSASLLHNMLLQVRTLSRRIQIQISVVQNLIAQFDSRTNISIAHDSKRIALDAKKDSVAMKTIAALTMVFLPGTFTATLFSMVFFHLTDGPESHLTVNSYWWLYVAVTVPLTGLVLAAWLGWLRWKERGIPKDVDIEA